MPPWPRAPQGLRALWRILPPVPRRHRARPPLPTTAAGPSWRRRTAWTAGRSRPRHRRRRVSDSSFRRRPRRSASGRPSTPATGAPPGPRPAPRPPGPTVRARSRPPFAHRRGRRPERPFEVPDAPTSISSSSPRLTADPRRARGSAAASLRSLLLPPGPPLPGYHPVGVEHALHPFHRRHDDRQVGDVGQLEGEPEGGDAVLPRLRRRRDDVHVLVSQHRGHVLEQLAPVQGLHLDRDEERGGSTCPPGHVDEALGLPDEVLGIRTVRPVDGHAVAASDEADDLVTWHRGAAPGELYPDVA